MKKSQMFTKIPLLCLVAIPGKSVFKSRQIENLKYSDVQLPVSIESAMGCQKICGPFDSTTWKNGKSRTTRRTIL